jgi:signal transduction histidine kinase
MASFKARARALDMLGRQQIAGIPTAISELFKNGHDAYASRVEADFYRRKRIFVLRDNGLGMTQEDFEDRWLTLGTDSKLGVPEALELPPIDESKPKRPIMGEKGIGRLAIAALGPQVLVLTRSKRGKKLGELIVAFINWRVFEAPGLDLQDIDFPLRSIAGGQLPSESLIQEMLDEAKKKIETLKTKLAKATVKDLLSDIDQFDSSAKKYLGANELSLAGNGHGTAFVIQPADENLSSDLDDRPVDRGAPPLVRMLIGFTNTLLPAKERRTDLAVRFRDHQADGTTDELIGESEFFTPEDFKLADHQIIGRFDARGTFHGSVHVYGKTPESYEMPWPAAKGDPSACGPFALRFAYIQGREEATRLAPDDYARLSQKLEEIGGIYIYRDGIRILPYGNSDFDFLDVERRRSKNAAYYFFSYRRMFGAIDISRESNAQLQEKAGREGFRANKGYRHFKAILENFLVQLAADFFRVGGSRADTWQQTRGELERNEALRKEREARAKATRDQFEARLEEVLAAFRDREPHRSLKELLTQVAGELKAAADRAAAEHAPELVIEAEADARKAYDQACARYRVDKPRGFALSRALRTDWEHYLEQMDAMEERVFAPARSEIELLATRSAESVAVVVDQYKRAQRGLGQTVDRARHALATPSKDVEVLNASVHQTVTKAVRGARDALEQTIALALTELGQASQSGGSPKALSAARQRLAADISAVGERETEHLERIREQLQATTAALADPDAAVGTNVIEAMEEELIALREQRSVDLSLAQLGMAVGIITHEFGASIKAVRHNLRRLKSWGDVNEKLRPLYRDLRTSFDHLDGYLSLFTPLQKRLTRRSVPIYGREISAYVELLFKERLERHSIELAVTPAFKGLAFEGYPSTFYPVVVNLVDNAMFWLGDRPQPRRILLDARDGIIRVGDTGPGVRENDRERIFDVGFTRKPGGRGLGLYIARLALEKSGYLLRLAAKQPDKGALFEIAPKEEAAG